MYFSTILFVISGYICIISWLWDFPPASLFLKWCLIGCNSLWILCCWVLDLFSSLKENWTSSGRQLSYLWISITICRLGFELFQNLCTGTFILGLNLTKTQSVFILHKLSFSASRDFILYMHTMHSLVFSQILKSMLMQTSGILALPPLKEGEILTDQAFLSYLLTTSFPAPLGGSGTSLLDFKLLNFKGWKEN